MNNYKEYTLTDSEIRKKTIISFVIFIVLLLCAVFVWKWVHRQPDDNGSPQPLRSVLNANGGFFSSFFSNNHLAKTFPASAAVHHVRVNGSEGMSDNFDAKAWKLNWIRKPGDNLRISMEDIKALPKTEIIFDFKCIEGWSQVTHWAGVKFSDFVAKYGVAEMEKMKYGGLMTPDSGYYVGIDMASLMHPQTILCYEMNGEPLPMNQGFPLRLIIPTKYGIKHLKRIGTIYFSNERPPDYWYERGYDYYSGL